MKFIEVTHIEGDADRNWKQASLQEVMINSTQIISIQRIWLRRRIRREEWGYTSTEFWRVICRDSVRYVVTQEDAQKLLGGE